MTTKRTPIRRGRMAVVDTAFRANAVRLLALHDDHRAAIRGSDEAFYRDGRWREMIALSEAIHPVLGIKPWHDAAAMIRAEMEPAVVEQFGRP